MTDQRPDHPGHFHLWRGPSGPEMVFTFGSAVQGAKVDFPDCRSHRRHSTVADLSWDGSAVSPPYRWCSLPRSSAVRRSVYGPAPAAAHR
jgi:hypothetical protein